MSNYAVVLQHNNLVVKSSNFGELNNLGFTLNGKVASFVYNEVKYIAIYVYSTQEFIAYAEEVKFKALMENIKRVKGADYSGVDIKLWKNKDASIDITFKNYSELVQALPNDQIYGALRDDSGLCYNFHVWNYTLPYNGPKNPQLAPGRNESNRFNCESFDSSPFAKNFFETYQDFDFYDDGVISKDKRLVADVASLMKKTDEQMLLAFNKFTEIAQNVGPFKFTQDLDGSYSKRELLDYKKGLERWVQIYKEHQAQLAKLTEPEQMYIACNLLFKYNMLTLFDVDQKILMLTVLCRDGLSDLFFISPNGDYQERETLALKILLSITPEQYDSFLKKLISTRLKVKSNIGTATMPKIVDVSITLYKQLFKKIDDFFGKPNFTAFVKELNKMVLINNNIPPESTIPYTDQEIKTKSKGQFFWGSINDLKEKNKKNNVKYEIVKNTDTNIEFSETYCIKSTLVETAATSVGPGIPVSGGYYKKCLQNQTNHFTLEHFDIVFITFYENPSFVDNNPNNQYQGKSFFTFAGYVDYLFEKEKTETILNVLNTTLFALTLAVGIGEVVAAVRSAQVVRFIVGAIMVAGDTSQYLTSSSAFVAYLEERYPEDFQDILDVMRTAGILASIGSGTVIGSGIFKRYTKIEAARFWAIGERVLEDTTLASKLTQNERAILEEGIKRFKDGGFPVRYTPEVISEVRRTEGIMKFYDDLILRGEIEILDEAKKIRFLDDAGDAESSLVRNLKYNPDFVPHWDTLSDAEKNLFKNNKTQYFNNWYKAKVVTLAEQLRASGIWIDVRKGIPYKLNELETIVEINIKYKANLRPNLITEAGDAIATSGSEIGRSFDVMGIPKEAFEKFTWTDPKQRILSIEGFKKSIRTHFRKIDTPQGGLPALDKIVLDFKNFDEFDSSLRIEIMQYINSPSFEYKHLVNSNYFETIN